MTLPAAILLLISASMHATWNLFSKRENPSAAFMLVANILGTLCLLPVVFLFGDIIANLPGRVWGYLLLTGLCQMVYYIGLVGAYQAGDLSVAYPLLRAMPVLLVAAFTQLLGRGALLSIWAILGMTLVVAGCLIIPIQHFSEVRGANYWNLACLFALVAALGTTGYSLIDSEALRLLRLSVNNTYGSLALPIVYSLLEDLSLISLLALFVLLRKSERQALLRLEHGSLRQAALVGVNIVLAYTLVLFAMTMVTNVSYVVAYRQLSIPLGALLGVIVLKEPPYLPKFMGVAVAFVGLVLVGIG
jgi:drug/metabolite transporter (DMT)-like permease